MLLTVGWSWCVMTELKNSIPQDGDQVNSVADQGSLPSLDNIPHSNAWNSQQKRIFQRSMSWCIEAKGRGCQLFWVMLSTAPGGDASKLGRHFQELRRRVEREYHYEVEYFSVRTREGLGVLHMIWAIKAERAVWIPQAWLADEWEKIHGARVVWIKRMGGHGRDVKKVSRYMVSQYLADQKALVHASWSWWRSRVAIARAWVEFKKLVRPYMERDVGVCIVVGSCVSICEVTYQEMLASWEKLLTVGECVVANLICFMSGRGVEARLR